MIQTTVPPARRIAANIAKLPELLQPEEQRETQRQNP